MDPHVDVTGLGRLCCSMQSFKRASCEPLGRMHEGIRRSRSSSMLSSPAALTALCSASKSAPTWSSAPGVPVWLDSTEPGLPWPLTKRTTLDSNTTSHLNSTAFDCGRNAAIGLVAASVAAVGSRQLISRRAVWGAGALASLAVAAPAVLVAAPPASASKLPAAADRAWEAMGGGAL